MNDDNRNIEIPKNWQSRLASLKERPTLCVVGYDLLVEFNIPHFTDIISGVWSRADSALNPFTSQAHYHAVMKWIDWRKKTIGQSRNLELTPRLHQQESLFRLKKLQQLLGFDIVDQTPCGLLAANQLCNIYELYGDINRAKCRECGKRYDNWTYEASSEKIILCEDCGGWIFPDISMFGWNEQVETKSKLLKKLDAAENLLCIGVDLNLPPFLDIKSTLQKKQLVEIKPYGISFNEGNQLISYKEIAKVLGYSSTDSNALEKAPSKLSAGLTFLYWLTIALYVDNVGTQNE